MESPGELALGTTVRLLYLGRIAEWKAPDVAIRAIQELNRNSKRVTYCLDLAGAALFGEEAYERRVRDLASSTANVRFLGHVQDPVSLMWNYDGLVHCSILPEPFGQVVVQSMAAGLVTFASNAGGPKEIIANGVNGILYEPGDPYDLASRMEETFSDPCLTERLRNAGRKRSLDFVDEKLVRLLDRSFLDLTNG
ncbi:glycosyltransferase [Rhodococcus sp. 14C212]|uniref:glycosyltransferase n=1 Tax=Rhodococcus sp. 14C212 TaxID=2711209 RepID=UPI0013EB1CA4|nr:glycosyltransferase [Rhodococcus sp. 14C212]